jgi:hypothetical protein
MKENTQKSKPHSNFKRKNHLQKTFEVHLSNETKANLLYFIKQELAYYNALIENLTPWLRTFPQELIAFKGNEKRIWNTVAEFGLNAKELSKKPLNEWPDILGTQKEALYNIMIDSAGVPKLSPRQLELLKILSAPAKLPNVIRNIIASEMLKHMQSQAEILESALKTEVMRGPVQMLQQQTLESKRHLQIPAALVSSIKYNETDRVTEIRIPYTNQPLVIHDVDLTNVPYKLMVVRSPHPGDRNGKWHVDLKDTNSYLIGLTDYDDRRRRK